MHVRRCWLGLCVAFRATSGQVPVCFRLDVAAARHVRSRPFFFVVVPEMRKSRAKPSHVTETRSGRRERDEKSM